MNTKFQPKVFQGKKRLFVAIKSAKGVTRIYIWDDDRKEYFPAKRNSYSARKTVFQPSSGKKRVQKLFESLDEARNWIYSNFVENTIGEKIDELTFGQLVSKWKAETFPRNQQTTNDRYEDMLRVYFSGLNEVPVSQITPKAIDDWIAFLKDPKNGWIHSSRRKRFAHELELLNTILRFHQECDDSNTYRVPIKKRHRASVALQKNSAQKRNDLSFEDFLKFRSCLKREKWGDELSDLATVQYFHALRISEVVGLAWENVHLDVENPSLSKFTVTQSLQFRRRAGVKPEVREGYKNARANGGSKGSILTPETFQIFLKRKKDSSNGLIFKSASGAPWTYRSLQYFYNKAFQRAGLPFQATHILRHGGCRLVFDAAGGDLAIAKQHLGNSDDKTALVYAKRSSTALNTLLTEKFWKSVEPQDQVTIGDT